MKTQDCIHYLISHYPDTKASEWKRRSKKQDEGVVYRIFENIKSGIKLTVVESQNKIVECKLISTSTKCHSKYVYAIDKNPDHLEGNEDIEVLLIIGTREVWEKNHHCSDYDAEETTLLIESIGLYPVMEATWSIPIGKTQEVINLLSNHPDYDNDAGFQKFIAKTP